MLNIPLFRSATGQKTFHYRTVNIWNNLNNVKLCTVVCWCHFSVLTGVACWVSTLCLNAVSQATAVSMVMSMRERSTLLLVLVKLMISNGEFVDLLIHVVQFS